MSAASAWLRLPLRFDVERMQADLAGIGAADWVAHFNTNAYEHGWSCAPLRSAGGSADHIMPLDGVAYQDTALLQRCPYLREVIAAFACDKQSVRLMALAPGAVIKEHRDPGTALRQGLARIHVPIQTAPEVRFHIDGEPVCFSAGHAWYLDASCRHAVHNGSALARVHLILDCVPNDWLAQLFLTAGFIGAAGATGAANAFDARERLLRRGAAVSWEPGMPMQGWFPVAAGGAPLQLCWRFVGQQRFTDPFFDNTLALQAPAARRRCDTPAAALDAVGPVLAPSAFLFHVSRCGSTLLTQMLAALPHCVVMSEPPVIDALLRRHHDGGHADAATAALLRQAVCALGQRRFAAESHFVVKLDCWHIHSLPLIRLAFPATPCFFLYREPGAVLASHRRQRGPQMVPGLLHPALLPLAPRALELAPSDLDGYAARVLESFFEAGARFAQAGQLELLNYQDLPGLVGEHLLGRLGIACDSAQMSALRQRALFHAKHAGAPFQGDPAEAVRYPADPQLQQLYGQLENQRLLSLP